MSKKILIVDDEEDIVITLSALLEMKNYETMVARDGEEALNKLESYTPDLIILDLMMPKVSGLQVLKILKADPEKSSIPVLVLSAIGQNSDKTEEFWKMGLKSDDFISKPFDVNVLVGRIEYLLRMSQYVSSRKPGTSGSPSHANPSSAVASGFSFDTPENTVKAFLEAYNNQAFAVEYSSLSKSLRAVYPPEEQYVASRNKVYSDEIRFNRKSTMERVVTRLVREQTATLIVIKKTSSTGNDQKEKIRFDLAMEQDGWKISSIRPMGPA